MSVTENNRFRPHDSQWRDLWWIKWHCYNCPSSSSVGPCLYLSSDSTYWYFTDRPQYVKCRWIKDPHPPPFAPQKGLRSVTGRAVVQTVTCRPLIVVMGFVVDSVAMGLLSVRVLFLHSSTTNDTRVGTLIVATIYLQLIQNRYMFRSFTVLQCSHQHCVQPVASDVEVVGKL